MMQLATAQSWEDRYIAAIQDATIDILIDCATEVPEILPESVCAVGQEPERDKVRAWATHIAENDIDSAHDFCYDADQILKQRQQEAQEVTA